MPDARSRSLRRWLAVLLPALVFSSGFLALQRPAKATGKAAAFERKLKSFEADVLVLGSSLARTNVRVEQLAEELGVSERSVVMLTLPNATAAHWYAIMRNRVFANGHRPRVVVLVGALTTMVTPEILMDSNVERLMNQLSEDEPVIGAKVLGTTNPITMRYLFMRERAGFLRDELLAHYRDWALTQLYGSNGKIAEGHRLAERANELVFADEAMDYGLHAGQSTGLYGGAVEQIDLTGIDVARDSLIPDIAELALLHGTNVVFVRTPFPPSNNDNDLVDPVMEREAERVMEASGAGYLDMRSLNLDDSYFQDMRHMSREGATLFTAALGASLREMGVLGGAGAQIVDVGLSARSMVRVGQAAVVDLGAMEREGPCLWRIPLGGMAALSDAALLAAGHPGASPLRVRYDGEAVPWRDLPPDACDWGARVDANGLHLTAPTGASRELLTVALPDEPSLVVEGEDLPSWWVYPGTTLRLTFDQPWPHAADEFRVSVLGHVFGGGDGAPRVRVGADVRPMQRLRQRAWFAEAVAPPTELPWTLEIEVPADGPWLLLQNLAVGSSPRTSHLIGVPEQLNGASIRLVGGRVQDTHLDPVYRTPPPALELGKIKKAPRDIAMVSLVDLAELADAPHPRATRPHKCSPIRIYEDGVPLAVHHELCMNMATMKAGRSCHAGNVLYFSASDGSNPLKNGRDYQFRLAEDRLCDRRNQRDTTPLRGVLWLYPGDQLVLQLPADRLASFYDGANRLQIEVEAPVHREGEALDARLFVQGKQVLQTMLEAPVARRKVYDLPLTPALPPRAQDVRLEIRNPSPSAYWLVLMATLSEEYGYGFEVSGAGDDEAVDTDASGAPDAADAQGEEALYGDLGADPFTEVPAPEAVVFPEGPDLGLRAPARVVRIGGVPAAPDLKEPEEIKDGVFEGRAFVLWPVSNTVLEKAGLGAWSPVLASDGAGALTSLAARKSLRADCGGCFLHAGQSILVRPRAGNLDDLRLAFDPALPVLTPSGQSVHWVYPGGAALYGSARAWAGEQLLVRAELTVHTFDKKGGREVPLLKVSGVEQPFEQVGDRWVAVAEVRGRGRGAWDVQIVVPADGPYVVLHELKVADAEGVATWVARPLTVPAGAQD
jgi:hypothetical protein